MHKVYKALNWLNRHMSTIITVLIVVLMIAVISVTGAQVFRRYVIGSSIIWSEEMARYLLVWITYLGAVLGLRTNAHLGLDFFRNLLPKRIRKWVVLLTHSLSVFFLYYLCKYGIVISLNNLARNQISPALGWQMGYVYLAIPIGAFFMILVLVEAILKELAGEK